ncbi:MAG: RNA polymerase factor sigma-54 [Planctomycetes bacterium]|nr:RNA polymerase factor sigma-54 [Planctomycetota bacterium]
MRMEIGLSQQLAQKQILSPQMIQSMEILQLNSLELDEKIREELEENCTLELVEPNQTEESAQPDGTSDEAQGGTQDESLGTPPGGGDGAQAPAEASRSVTSEIDLLRDRYEHLAEFQAEEYYTNPGRISSGGADDEERLEALENAPGRAKTLHEHLMDQIRMLGEISPRLRDLTQEIVYNLDHRGFLLYPLPEILEALNRPPAESQNGVEQYGIPIALPIGLEELEAALGVVQGLDPAGVGALDLRSCLLLQLERGGAGDSLERTLVENHLEDIAHNRLPQIARATTQPIDAIKEAIEVITSLNPNPGGSFSASDNSRVRPDVFVSEEGGIFKVRVENEALPRLRISRNYREMFEVSKKNPEVRSFLKRKIENAEWLLNAIQQRRSTLQRVAEEVVNHQQEFFRNGYRHLKPLKMQEIADRIGVNVSTVSRAISGKYFQAPGFVKELKFLFTGGTVRDDGVMESRGSVIERIRDLIAKEDGRKPLSDSRIVSLLSREGINISRRTVTKYREAESIPSSRERRSY